MTPRALIRKAVAAALLNKTRAQARVYSSRSDPMMLKPTALGGSLATPAVLVYTRKTTTEVFDQALARRYRCEAEVVVECWDTYDSDAAIDDEIDAFEQEVLAAVLADDTLGDTCDDLVLKESVNDVASGGAKPVAAVIITLGATFYAEFPLEGTGGLDDLATVHTEHSLDGRQADARDRAITHSEGLNQ